MASKLTSEERSWLRVMYAEELDLPIDDEEYDGAEEGEILILGSALRPMLVAQRSLVRRGLIALGAEGLYVLTPKGRALAKELLS